MFAAPPLRQPTKIPADLTNVSKFVMATGQIHSILVMMRSVQLPDEQLNGIWEGMVENIERFQVGLTQRTDKLAQDMIANRGLQK